MFERLVTPVGYLYRGREVTREDFSLKVGPLVHGESGRQAILYQYTVVIETLPELRDELMAISGSEKELFDGMLRDTYFAVKAYQRIPLWETQCTVNREVRTPNVTRKDTLARKDKEALGKLKETIDSGYPEKHFDTVIADFNNEVAAFMLEKNRETMGKLEELLRRDRLASMVDGYPVCDSMLTQIREAEAELLEVELKLTGLYAGLQRLRETTLLAHMEKEKWTFTMNGEDVRMPDEFIDGVRGQVEHNNAFVIPNVHRHSARAGMAVEGVFLSAFP